MSVKVLTYVLENSAQKGNELLTLIVLADHANEQGLGWPSVVRIAKLIRADERTARRCIRRLEQSGELKLRKGDGKGGTNLYWIPMQETLELFPDTPGNSPPGKLPPRTKRPETPDTAVSPEPSGTVIKSKGVAGQGKPSPVAALFKAYQDGIAKAYGAEEPPSAKTNGQLAAIVRQLGAEPAMQVVRYYLESRKPYYVTRKHAMDVLARDARDLWIEIQQTAGGGAEPTPTKAVAYFEYGDGRLVEMADYPVAEHLTVARQAARQYATKIAHGNVKNVMVKIGREQRRFTTQELR